MKHITLLFTILIFAAVASKAQYGVLGKPEWQTCKDPVTGVTLTMLTDTTKNDRFLYQTDPMWTPDCKYLMFRSSSRSAEIEYKDKDGNKKKRRPTQLYFIETGERRQIASDCRMKPDHAQPFFSPDGKKLCFQSGRFSNGKRLTLMMADINPENK